MKRLMIFSALILASSLFAAESSPASYLFNLPDTPLSSAPSPITLGSFRAPNGASLGLNVSCFLRDGEPWLPVMGELHFSRVPEAEWDVTLEKMKKAGIEVVATYVFWNHHEEIQGEWDFSGERNLRKFAEKCASHGLFLWARIGPWCHGEALWGGFPEYVQKGQKRNNNPTYLGHVEKFYDQLGKQMEGLYFKDGGPIIGIQLENEFDFAHDEGYKHMKNLKALAEKARMDPPYWSATMWPAANDKATEFLLGLGGYPEAPWAQNLEQKAPSENFLYRKIRVDPDVGEDLFQTDAAKENKIASLMPLMTVELGGGNQVTWHRRPAIDELDCIAMAMAAVGSGGNGLGYYMFCGGINPKGKKGPLQESRASGYPNDCPLINYDFQAPIGSEGQMNPPYKHYTLFHSFLNHFGDKIALLPSVLPVKRGKISDPHFLRCGIRGTQDHGYLFFTNIQRYVNVDTQKVVQFALKKADGTVQNIPDSPIDFVPGKYGVWPYNMDCNGILLRYATAMPLKPLNVGDKKGFIFIADGSAEFAFERGTSILSAFAGGSKDKVKTPTGSSSFTATDSNGNTCFFMVFDRADLFKKSHELGPERPLPFVSISALSPEDVPCAAMPKGPRYGLDFKPIPGAKVYRIDLSKFAAYDGDGIVNFHYLGDTAGLYQDSRLIQDDFWYGGPMRMRLSRIPDLNRPLFLQITPISKEWPVFFNEAARKMLPAVPSAELKGVSFQTF